jgi:hypothetical protein
MVLSLYYPFLSIDNIYMSVKFRNSDGTTQLGYIDLVNINMTVMNQQNGNLILGTNNAEDMRILTNGNVGIGTQTPEFTLDVNGNARIGTTSTNTFTLFNNPFAYVPWTTIINHSGTTNAATNFNTHICNVSQSGGGPTPPTGDANLRFTYQYSVVGKTLYADLFYYQNVAGGAGTSTGAYFFFLPPPYKTSSDSGKLSPILVSSSLAISGITGSTRGLGTRIGSGGCSSSTPNADNLTAYYHVSSSTPYIVLYSQTARVFNGTGYFQLTFVGSIQINFQVAIPLA